MPWEEFKPGVRGPLSSGVVTIGSRGQCQFFVSDLKEIGVDGAAAVLIDRPGRMIALVPPVKGQHCVTVSRQRDMRSARITLGKVLREIGVDPREVAGRRPVRIENGNRLVIDFKERSPVVHAG